MLSISAVGWVSQPVAHSIANGRRPEGVLMVEGVLRGDGEGLGRRATATQLLPGHTRSDRVRYYSQR